MSLQPSFNNDESPLFKSFRKFFILTAALVLLPRLVTAEVAPTKLEKTLEKAWVGERVPFFINLRSPAAFAGTATFDLPPISGTTVIQIGSPVVSSEKIEDEQWSIQRHEFALFCQRSGTLNIPEFTVRFTRKETFTGPEKEVTGNVAAWSIEIQQPPGSAEIGHLITTHEFDVTEEWSPTPGGAKVGDVFKRTIMQHASNVSGMALAPTSKTVPKEMKIYTGKVQTNDKLERGDFRGERKDSMTYLLTGDGDISLPAVKYVWWNPKAKKLESKTLPAVNFKVQPAPVVITEPAIPEKNSSWIWIGFLFLAAIGYIAVSHWSRIRELASVIWRRMNPPDRVAARKLLRACRANDVVAAETAWSQWRFTQASGFQPEKELVLCITEMHRYQFAEIVNETWSGEQLAAAFRKQRLNSHVASSQLKEPALPSLNP